MRFLTLAVVLFLSPLAYADDAADARAIIDKAVKASGGEAARDKFKSQTFREKGTFYGMGEGLPYTGIYTVQWPERFRMEIEGVFTMVIAGDKGWVKTDKGVEDMTAEQLAREKNNLHGGYVTTLIPLKDKSFTLATLPETKVDDKPALGVKVSQKDRPDVTLWFDKTTGLLVKSEQMVQPEDPEAKPVKQETTFGDYKEFAGYKIPTKVVAKREGKLFVEATISDMKPLEKVDDKLFMKP